MEPVLDSTRDSLGGGASELPQLAASPSLFKRAWRVLLDFWIAPIRAEPLALMRIVAALGVLLSALTTIAPNLSLFWFDEGIIPAQVSDQMMSYGSRASILYGVTSHAAIIAWFVLWMIALLFLLVGCYSRIACIIAWVLAVSFNIRGLWTLNGGDDVAVHLLFYLMLSPCGAAWSIDSLRRRLKTYRDPESGFELPQARPTAQPTLIEPWSVRLMLIQLVIMYLLNGINKMNLAQTNDYLTGEAVYWALNDATLTRFAFDMLPAPMWVCRLLSWATLLFEFSFVIFICLPRVRPVLLWAGVLFHAGILATMEIGWFGQFTLCYYPVFISGAAVAGAAALLARRGSKKKYVVCFDTFCPVCRRSKFALELFDVGKRLTYLDIHDRPAMEAALPGVGYTRALREMLVIAPSGKITGGFDAFRTVMRVLPALWILLPVLYLPGAVWIGRRIYKAVARNRYKLVKCDQGVCNLHLMALSRENLDEEEIARVVQGARDAAMQRT